MRNAIAATLVLCAFPCAARDLVDMAGRKVVLPDKIRKIHAAQPYTNVAAYMVAPDLLVGQLLEPKDSALRFTRPEYLALPVLGGAPGSGKEMNLEMVLAAKPDLILLKGGPKADSGRGPEKLAKLGTPLVYVDLDPIDGYPAALEFLGRLLGREEKAAKMAALARKMMTESDQAAASIPPGKRPKVYYAETPDGLSTECDQSFHADAIKRAGGEIVHKCVLRTHMGMERVSLEQVLQEQPEWIVSYDPQFEATVYADPRWKGVQAVKDRRVLTVPRTPFNWIDRPPSLTRIAGIAWLAHRFNPKGYKGDLRRELLEFHQLFLGTTPTTADLDSWCR